MSNSLIQFIVSILLFLVCLFAFNRQVDIFGTFKKFRLYSEYYPKFAYFTLFSIITIFYSKYVVTNHITPIPIVALMLPFVVILIIPLGTLYYIIRSSIHIGKIAGNKFQETIINKLIWLCDVIYLFIVGVLIYIEIRK